MKRKAKTYGRPAVTQQTKSSGTQRQAVGSEKTIKQLLGELYGDRQYLEKLLKETGKYFLFGDMCNPSLQRKILDLLIFGESPETN